MGNAAVDYSAEVCERALCDSPYTPCVQCVVWHTQGTCVECMTCMVEKRKVESVLGKNPEAKRQCGRSGHRWEDMELDIKGREWEGTDWIGCGSEQGQMWALLDMVMDFQMAWSLGIFCVVVMLWGSQEGLCSMQWFSWSVGWLFDYLIFIPYTFHYTLSTRWLNDVLPKCVIAWTDNMLVDQNIFLIAYNFFASLSHRDHTKQVELSVKILIFLNVALWSR